MTKSGLLYGQNETLHDRKRCMALVCGGDFAKVKGGGRGIEISSELYSRIKTLSDIGDWEAYHGKQSD